MSIKLSSKEAFERVAGVVLGASTADHTRVNFSDGRSSTLRFANNQVAQHVSVDDRRISVQVAFDQKVGRATTNRIDAQSLKQVVRQAERIARLAPADPEYMPPLESQQYLDIATYHDLTAQADPGELARRTKPVVEKCEARNLYGAGIMTASADAVGVAASSGLFAYEKRSEARFSVTATSRSQTGHSEADSSGWTFNAHRDIDKLDVARRADIAVDKALTSRNPREVEAGYHTVILEPAAVAGVFGPVAWSLFAKSYHKGTSALSGKLGTQVLDSRLSVVSDPTHPDLLGNRFGRDGMAAAPTTWFDRGVLKNLYYDRFTAKEHGASPTPPGGGQILRFNGPQVANLDELIAGTQRGILITNFWYIRYVNPTDLTLTGMTRDGTFLIENGKIAGGVKNFRFHESPLRAFASVKAATAPAESITIERGKMLLPAVRLPKFNLSSVTKF
ncbi:MAG: TldD/PmbA family protein [Phycisphaerae bacterium]